MPTSRPPRQPSRSTETVLARAVTHILGRAQREGVNRAALIEAAGLESVDLSHPDARVTLSSEVALWQLIAKSTADPGFGIRVGASLRVRDAGLLGYVMYYSSTLDAALRRLVRYSRVLTEAVQFTLGTSHRHQATVAECHPSLGVGLPYAVDNRLAALVGACREITRVEVVPSEVAFAYDEPASTLEHRRFFRCPLRFGQPVSQVVLLERDLALPVSHGDEALAGYLGEHAEQVLRTLVTGTSTRERVRSAIWAVLSEGRPTLSRIAAALQMPSRTLQRRLAQEGTSLHREIEHIRKTMATAALRHRQTPIEEVAFVLGYTEPSTFYRSFKRWTGKTPHRYRTEAA
jgi:AraC-like DNA-binding protein